MKAPALAIALSLTIGAVAPASRAADGPPGTPTAPATPIPDPAADRLKKIVEASPEPGYALDLLFDHYRTRRGGLGPLVEEYRARTAAEPALPLPWLMLGLALEARGDLDEAAAALSEAAARSPKDARPHYAAARAWAKVGDVPRARAAYEAARARLEGKHGWAEKKLRGDVLRALGGLALDEGDLPAARTAFTALVRTDPTSPTLAFELPRALASRGKTAEAITELEGVARAAGKDGKTRVLALLEIGALLEERRELDRALETYRSALKSIATTHYLAGELEDRIAGVYRKRDDLRGLLGWYEARGGATTVHQLEIMGGLYEEVGRDDDAVATYRKLLARKPSAVEVRVRLIGIYRRIGRAAEMLAEYERLIRAAPDEPRWRLDYAAVLHGRGDRAKAMATLAGLSARYSRDASVRLALADLYTRWGERARAVAELEALRKIEPKDESHRISLGELYWQGDDRDRAVAEWTTLLDIIPDRARAEVRVGEVLGEHGLIPEALAHFATAERLRPGDPGPSRGRGILYEREKRWVESREAWEVALGLALRALPRDDRMLAEAREHLVDTHDRASTLLAAVGEWRAAFDADPPEWEAGHLLGMALARLGKSVEAASVLEAVARAHADSGTLAAIERLHVGAERWAEAIAVLEKRAALEPGRARELYARMAEYYANLYDDTRALEYARKAVDLGPGDAKAWERLAAIYLRMRDRAGALAAYEKAAALAPRAFHLIFALAHLHGEDPRADVLLLEVMRMASEESDLVRAARAAIRRATTAERLAVLETELLALYHRPPARKVFRTILVEVYGDMVGPLWRGAGDPAGGAAARAALRKIGERALKPLVDALADEEGMSRAVATELLGCLGNPGAALPLARMLEETDVGLRLRAIVALGRLGDLRGAPALARALAEPEIGVRTAAAWAVGMIRSPNTVEYLVGREGVGTRDPKPDVRAMAALALGTRGDPAAGKPLIALLGDPQPTVRRAAAWALARLGTREAVGALRTVLLTSPEGLVRRAAAGALGRLGDASVVPALLAASWDGDAALRPAALDALTVLLGRPGPLAAPPDLEPFQDASAARVDVEALVATVERDLTAGGDSTTTARALLTEHLDVVVDTVRAALAGTARAGASSDPGGAPSWGATSDPAADSPAPRAAADSPVAARAALDLDLLTDRISLGALTVGAAPGGEGATALAEPLRRFGEAVAPVLADALGRATGRTRIRLAGALGKTRSRDGTAALLALRADADPGVREAVADALARIADPVSAAALAALATDGAWIVRVKALRGLGALRDGSGSAACGAALAGDRFSVVKEAAALALADIGPAAHGQAVRLAAALRHEDAAVRAAAATALGAVGDPAYAAAVERLLADPDERVKRAAGAALERLRLIR